MRLAERQCDLARTAVRGKDRRLAAERDSSNLGVRQLRAPGTDPLPVVGSALLASQFLLQGETAQRGVALFRLGVLLADHCSEATSELGAGDAVVIELVVTGNVGGR